jgi:serine/threonine-protein kinase
MSPNIADVWRRSLAARLFFTTGALVLGTVLVALGLTALRANGVASQSVGDALTAAREAQVRAERDRVGQLRLMSRLVAGDPTFVAYVADGDPASVHDLLLERQRDLHVDFAAVLDRRGHTIARTDRPPASADSLDRAPLVVDALARGESDGVLRDGDRYWTAAAVPLVSGGVSTEGLLVTGFAIDDALALEVRRQSGSEVAYVALAPEPRVVASTVAADQELLHAIAERMRAAPRANLSAPQRLALGGRQWAMQLTELGSARAGATPRAPDDRVVSVTLASIDEALAPFRRIEGALVMVGVLSLIAAFAASYALSRRITEPIARLASAVESAREGRFTEAVATQGSDEVARLGQAFQGLLGELSDQREMADYLQAISRSIPDAAVTPPADDEALVPNGEMFANRFEILGWIGAGGMGVVYRARDRELNDVVALKTLRRVTPEHLNNLKSELLIARRITHRHVLRTHDFGEAQGVPFISMEYVRGVTLRGLIDHADRLPTSVVLRIARQLLAGLGAAHALGVTHRDIKPENLLLEPTGQLRIMDFGIASIGRAAVPDGGHRMLQGTPVYVAPELLRGEPGDVRTDLYAVGVVLYELLTGRRPAIGGSISELFYRIANEDPPPLRNFAPEVPESIERVVMRCLARDPNQRYTSTAELAKALEEARA